MRERDRFRGCLIGGAAGDALGYTVEFMGENMIFSRYGEKGITEYRLTDGVAEISDDTQMTLFTASGILTALAEGRTDFAKHINDAYLDWLRTQRDVYPLPEGKNVSPLLTVPELFSRRAPGNTCMAALEDGGMGTPEEQINNSKGCGGVMRAAPAGLISVGARDCARLGAEAAALTHGHILGFIPAAVLAQTVHELIFDDTDVRTAVGRAMDTVEEMWPETPARIYFKELMNKAIALAEEDIPDLDAIHQLGGGWVGEEALAIAVFCAVRHENNFDAAMIAAVNHRGDSDSTGAVAGNILGARLGLKGIPEKYTEHLELKELILEIADDLHAAGACDADPAWKQKYL